MPERHQLSYKIMLNIVEVTTYDDSNVMYILCYMHITDSLFFPPYLHIIFLVHKAFTALTMNYILALTAFARHYTAEDSC